MWAQEVLERERYCKRCRRYVLARQKQAPLNSYAALTLFTCLLALPLVLLHMVWFAIFQAGYMCPRCGKTMW